MKVKDGKFVFVGDPKKPFMCWPVTDPLKWSQPTPTDVAG